MAKSYSARDAKSTAKRECSVRHAPTWVALDPEPDLCCGAVSVMKLFGMTTLSIVFTDTSSMT
jgi:hypothetical protein